MQVLIPPRNRTPGVIDAMGLMGIIGFLVARFVPIAKLIPFWGCSFRQTFGWPCPGCGLTRVADRFSHLNFTGAFLANPLGTVAAAGFALAIVLSAVHLIFGVPLPEVVLSEKGWARVRWAALTLFVVNYGAVIVLHRMSLA